MQNDEDLGSRKDSADSTATSTTTTTSTSRAPSERQQEPPQTATTRQETERVPDATTTVPKKKESKEKKNSKEKEIDGSKEKDKRRLTESSKCDRRYSAPTVSHYGNYPSILCVPCPCFGLPYQGCTAAYAMYHPVQADHAVHHQPQPFHDCNRCHSSYYRPEPSNFYDPGYANRWPSSHCSCDANGGGVGGHWPGHGQVWSAAEGCCPPTSSDFRLFAPRPPARRCRREYYLQIPKGRCRTEEEDLDAGPEETVTEAPPVTTTTTLPPRPTNFPVNFRLQKAAMVSPIGNKRTTSRTDINGTTETNERGSYMVLAKAVPQELAGERQTAVVVVEQPIQETAASVLRKRHNEIKRQEIQEMLENDVGKTNSV